MAKRICKLWKQIISFYATHTGMSQEDTAFYVKENINLLEYCGLVVECVVSDQGGQNRGCYKILKKEQSVNFFYQNGKKVFIMHDYPHLFKCIRNA